MRIINLLFLTCVVKFSWKSQVERKICDLCTQKILSVKQGLKYTVKKKRKQNTLSG